MTKQEKANEKRLNNAVINHSCTKQAQLKALSHKVHDQLTSKDSDGNITIYTVTKYEQLEKLGLVGKFSKSGTFLGYGTTEYNNATDDDLKYVGTDGKVKMNYIYRERVMKVSVGSESEGWTEESLYTSEEADKKVKGEKGAKTIKVYRKCIISEYGWSPRMLESVLEQSRSIAEHQERAAASMAQWEELKKGDLYIVQNRNGKLVKVKVRVEDVNM
jgi:hypothetical protein